MSAPPAASAWNPGRLGLAPGVRYNVLPRPTAQPVIHGVRPLTRDEVASIPDPGDTSSPRNAQSLLSNIRGRHHAIARDIASGLLDSEIRAIHGMTQQALSIIRDSPAFQDLLSHYLEAGRERALELRERITAAAVDAVDALHGRILDPAAKIPTKLLIEATRDLLDRAGHSPVSRVHLKAERSLGAEDIEALKAELRRGEVDVSPAPAPGTGDE